MHVAQRVEPDLDHSVDRLARKHEQHPERLEVWWPFAAWAALGAYVDFWDRTGRRLVVADPSPANVIVPLHDYLSGARLVSISSRAPFDCYLSLALASVSCPGRRALPLATATTGRSSS